MSLESVPTSRDGRRFLNSCIWASKSLNADRNLC